MPSPTRHSHKSKLSTHSLLSRWRSYLPPSARISEPLAEQAPESSPEVAQYLQVGNSNVAEPTQTTQTETDFDATAGVLAGEVIKHFSGGRETPFFVVCMVGDRERWFEKARLFSYTIEADATELRMSEAQATAWGLR